MRLRTYLIALVAVATLPILAFAAWTSWRAVAAERSLAAQELARLAATAAGALETEFGRAIMLGQTLAVSPALLAGDIEGFARQGYDAAAANGTSFAVGAEDGRQTFNSRFPLGQPIPARAAPDIVQRLRELGRPFVTGVFEAPLMDAPIVAVIVPVTGAPPQVAVGIGVRVDLPRLERLLPTPVTGPGGFSLVLDGSGAVAARTSDAPASFPSAGIVAAPAGSVVGISGTDGGRLAAVRQPIAGTDWQVVVAMPRDLGAATAWRSLRWLGIGGAAGVVLAVILATGLAAFLLRQARSLTEVAAALNGNDAPAARTRVAEVAVLRHALEAAGAALRSRAEAQARLSIMSEAAAMLEARVAERTRELEETVGRLLNAEDEERRRIARDLHDSTVQELVAASLGISRAQAAPEQAAEALTDAAAALGRAKQELRTVAFLLQPPLLDECGLAMAVRVYAEGVARRSGIAIEVEAPQASLALSRPQETALFRVVQEALANSVTHAGATRVRIRLSARDGRVCAEVSDNGKGMARAGEFSGFSAEGAGIPGMRARIRQLGGALRISSGPAGTVVEASVTAGLLADGIGR